MPRICRLHEPPGVVPDVLRLVREDGTILVEQPTEPTYDCPICGLPLEEIEGDPVVYEQDVSPEGYRQLFATIRRMSPGWTEEQRQSMRDRLNSLRGDAKREK